ncbi:DUF4345 domain-containing protein [Agrobacterium sp. ES01]|uniref:AGROH133_08824 family phage infection protein n=1 Tax=Agrobacterium sp. ES01 TaxID=3420714 RepID=UPI003D119E39
MEFYFPTETGEQLAFCSAAFTILFGLILMFAPGLCLAFFGLQRRGNRNEGLSEARSIGGFYAGSGLAAVLLAQDLIYLTIGAAFAMAAFARILSIMSDSANSWRNLLLLIAQVILAAFPLVYVFQLI